MNNDENKDQIENRERFERAKAFLQMGFNVVPLGIKSKITPYKWKKYQQERITEDVLDCWYSAENERNWAILQGAISGTVAVECDDDDALAIMQKKCPPTPIKTISRKGQHWIYRHPGTHVRNRAKVTVDKKQYNLDIKGDGGFVVAPLSVHPSGHLYIEVIPWTKELIQTAPVFDPSWLGLNEIKYERPEWDIDDTMIDRPDLPGLAIRVDLARKWMMKNPGSKAGQGADNYCFALAIKLLKGFSLPIDDAADILWEWGQKDDNLDDKGFYYPWTHSDVDHKIRSVSTRTYNGYVGDLLKDWHLTVNLDDIIGSGTPPPPEPAPEPKSIPKTESKSRIVFESWSETKSIACKQKEDWLLPHWAEFGSLVVLTGLPFGGKSCIVAEIIGAIAKGEKFCKMDVPQVPFILLDLENRERILVKRVEKCLGSSDGKMGDLYHRINPKNIPTPVKHDWLKECIDAIKEKGGEKGLLVIDTMRSAFAGSKMKENDNDDMGALLYPLQQLAQSSGWCILLLHHNNKGSGHYSGAGVIAAAADYLWNWSSDKVKLTGELAMDGGRDDHQLPLMFKFDMDLQRNIFLGTKAEITKADNRNKKESRISTWLSILSDSAEHAKDCDDIRKLALNCGLLTDGTNIGSQNDHTREALNECIDLGYIVRIGKGKAGDRYRYYRTNIGTNVIISSQAKEEK